MGTELTLGNRLLLQNGFIIPGGGVPGAGAEAIPQSMNCNLECKTSANCPSTCAQQTKTFNNPSPGWAFECTGIVSCAASTYTINGGGGVNGILNGIKASAPYALYGTTITVNNVRLTEVDCGAGNCAGATFIFGAGGDYGDIKCEEYGGCGAGCQVQKSPTDALVPCDQVSTT